MALQIRRGMNSQRTLTNFVSGELVFVTDYQQAGVSPLFIGVDGSNGGISVAPVRSVNALTGNVVLNTDLIAEGEAKYYSANQAKADAGAALVAGNVSSSGISFSYSAGSHSISAVVSAGGYALPNAGPTTLGGVKVSAGGLQIDGAGLLSVTTPVSAGTSGHLTYYTGANAVGDAGTGLTWATTDIVYSGGRLTIGGTLEARRINLGTDLTTGGFKIESNVGGSAPIDLFTINTYHTDADAGGANFTRSRGSFASPAPLQSTDSIFKFAFGGKTTSGQDGVAGIAAAMLAQVDGTVTSGVLPGKFSIFTANASGELTPGLIIDKEQKATFGGRIAVPDGSASTPSIAFSSDGGVDTGFSHPGDGIIVVSTNATETARFDSGGFRSVGFVKVKDFAGNLPNPPEAGMIVLDGTTFKGYNGSAWVNLN